MRRTARAAAPSPARSLPRESALPPSPRDRVPAREATVPRADGRPSGRARASPPALHPLAHLQHLRRVGCAAVAELAHVDQAVDAPEIDEGPEVAERRDG